MKKQETHITKDISLYNAEIDIEIIELITILNKLWGVKTTYCCQGDKSKKQHKRKNNSYFGLFCSCIDSLNLIKEVCYITSLETQSNVEINTKTTYSQGIVSTVYYFYFGSKSDILYFQKILSKRYSEREKYENI